MATAPSLTCLNHYNSAADFFYFAQIWCRVWSRDSR